MSYQQEALVSCTLLCLINNHNFIYSFIVHGENLTKDAVLCLASSLGILWSPPKCRQRNQLGLAGCRPYTTYSSGHYKTLPVSATTRVGLLSAPLFPINPLVCALLDVMVGFCNKLNGI